MSKEEYYMLLKVKHDATDWNSLKSVQEYNAFARMLRHMLDEE